MENKETTVISYIEYLGNIISRMASNSSTCKNWSIMILTALSALRLDEQNWWLGLMPVLLFWLLDAYYLGLERWFINHQQRIAKMAENGEHIPFFKITGPNRKQQWCGLLSALRSFSTFGFYLIEITLYILSYGEN